MNLREKFKNCKQIDDKEERVSCLFETLHDTTKLQDSTNIQIMKTIDDSDDKRWLPIHMIDNSNAVILNISRLEGDINKIDELYLKEKIDGLEEKFNRVDWDGY